MGSRYLIVTQPFDDNPDFEFQTYCAKLKAGLKLKPKHLARFVMIEAKRIKEAKISGASFEIQSVAMIMRW